MSFGINATSEVQQLTVIKTLAKLQSSLSVPVPFGQIGSYNGEGKRVLGPLLIDGPYQSLIDLWRAQLEHEILIFRSATSFLIQAMIQRS
jgi:hypothetical protein